MTVVKSVDLRCDPARAFDLFTERAGEWWPAGRRHLEDAAPTVIRIEASGRFFERSSDGIEVELGVARAFEPARRLVLDWYPGTGPANPTQVEVRFEAIATGTRVTVTHGPGKAGVEMFGRNAPGYDRSWDLVLASLAAHD
jgi:uncharacterized protein YndB with AHSA1/START domain